METRGRAKAQAAQSSSTPVSLLEGQGSRRPVGLVKLKVT